MQIKYFYFYFKYFKKKLKNFTFKSKLSIHYFLLNKTYISDYNKFTFKKQ